jgi:hypothetical protein
MPAPKFGKARITVRNRIGRNFSARKNKWKSEKLSVINLEEPTPYEYNEISKKYYNFLRVLKEGRDKNTKMYVEYFKDLEIERFVELPNGN